MSRGTVERIGAILEGDGEPDDVLRRVVDTLVSEPGVVWAGIAFLEEGELVLGPAAGTPDESRRVPVPVSYQGGRVGELRVDGETDRTVLEAIAALVAPYVLIGWDTGGESWEP